MMNQYLEVECYPLLKPNGLFATLAGDHYLLESCKLAVINRNPLDCWLPFGLAPTPVLFQQGNGLHFARHRWSDLLY